MMGRRVRWMTIAMAMTAALMLGACAGALPAGLTAADVAAAGEAAMVDPLIEIRGTLDSVDTASITVAGKVVAILPETELKGTFVAGDLVQVQAAITAAGDLVAREIAPLSAESEHPGTASGHTEFTGLVESIAVDSWTVGGTPLAITPQTEVKDAIVVGDLVKVEATTGTDGALTATEIRLAGSEEDDSGKLEFTGLVEEIAADTWMVDGKALAITTRTEINGSIIVGDLVKVEATTGTDGALTALEITLAGAKDDSRDVDLHEVEFTGSVESIAADSWTVGGKTLAITSKTEIEDKIQVGDMVKVEATTGTDGVLVAKEIDLADTQDHGEDERSGDMEFRGVVEAISADMWTVGGRTLGITSRTEIKGDIKVGDSVKVEAKSGTDGSLVADEIKLVTQDSSGDDKGTDDHSGGRTDPGGHGDEHGSESGED
jgi:phenylpyruvate tautomerase PptA (4-oxalocrotonate tautomerase family)